MAYGPGNREGLRGCDEVRGLHVGDSSIVVPECLDDEVLVFVSTISRPLNHRHPSSERVASVKSREMSIQSSAYCGSTVNFAVMKITSRSLRSVVGTRPAVPRRVSYSPGARYPGMFGRI